MFLSKFDVERFWSKVRVLGPDDCWLWKMGRDKDGYGIFWSGGRKGSAVRAYRVSWFLGNGLIPELLAGLSACICHSCDNPPCCNPNHLFLGNQRINVKDCVNKERHPCVKISVLQVCGVKSLLREGKLTHKEIGLMYGISRSAVSAIGTGKTWSHVK